MEHLSASIASDTFNFLPAQWIFIVSSTIGIPWVFLGRYGAMTDRVEALEEARVEEEKAKEIAIIEAKREKERECALLEREKVEKKKRQKKESLDPNPWDSGFLG